MCINFLLRNLLRCVCLKLIKQSPLVAAAVAVLVVVAAAAAVAIQVLVVITDA